MVNPVVVLKTGREITAPRGHPWIFSGAVHEIKGTVSEGDFVEVVNDKGRWLSAGHWGTQSIAVRILSRNEGLSERDVIFRAIGNAFAYRRHLGLFDNKITNAFRLIHGEGDSLPGLIIDKYGPGVVVQFHTKGMSRVKPVIESALNKEGIFDIVWRSTFESDEVQESKLVEIVENGAKFKVDLTKGQKTGFFLDQRDNRLLLREISPGAEVLNVFSYTGGFSVNALLGFAKRVVSIDSSKSALELGEENIKLNSAQGEHESIEMDCFKYFAETKDKFDIVILDPPAFVKHKNAHEKGMKGYKDLNRVALKCIKQGGVLLTFSCSQLVSSIEFTECVRRAAQEEGRFMRVARYLSQASCHPISIFHPEGEYLKGILLYLDS